VCVKKHLFGRNKKNIVATEIERKFLVTGDQWRSLAAGTEYRQGYIIAGNGKTVRVRLVGEQGYLTIKGKSTGLSRLEFEYPIPKADVQEMLDTLCDRPPVYKTRYKIQIGDVVWEVDEFAGENEGLILAEVELTHERQEVPLPEWVGEEVTFDRRYYNSYLASNPFKSWRES
jgi:adenylate cyclase